jgi:hypothetical protein
MQRYEYEDAVLRSGLSTAAQRILFIYAAECIWKKGNTVYLSYSIFKDRYGVGKRTRDEWVPRLRAGGWIRDTGESAGQGGCDIYELAIPELVQEPAPVTEGDEENRCRSAEEVVQVSAEEVQASARSGAEIGTLSTVTNNDTNTALNNEGQLAPTAASLAPVGRVQESSPIDEDKEEVTQGLGRSLMPKHLGDTGAAPAPQDSPIRDKAEKELREYDRLKVKLDGFEPLTEEQIEQGVALMVKPGWQKNYTAWVQKASFAWGEVRTGPLVW